MKTSEVSKLIPKLVAAAQRDVHAGHGEDIAVTIPQFYTVVMRDGQLVRWDCDRPRPWTLRVSLREGTA